MRFCKSRKPMGCLDWWHRWKTNCVACSCCHWGFHSVSTYQWSRAGKKLRGESTPLAYVVETGSYTCSIKSDGVDVQLSYVVSGVYNRVIYYTYYILHSRF